VGIPHLDVSIELKNKLGTSKGRAEKLDWGHSFLSALSRECLLLSTNLPASFRGTVPSVSASFDGPSKALLQRMPTFPLCRHGAGRCRQSQIH